jgi:hypothetical protein
VLDDIDAQYEDFKQAFPAQLEAAQTKAELLADALLTDAWRRLIGPAWKLLHALMVETATSNNLFGPGDHVFSSLEDVGRLAGVSKRTVQRWLDESYKGRSWLEAWVQRRTLYMTRDDGLPCRAGTVFRVSLEARPTHDLTPAPRPRLEALKARWRFSWELPEAQGQSQDLENTVCELKCREKAGTITFPVKQGRLLNRVQVEGRDMVLSSSTLNSNKCQTQKPVWKPVVSASGVLFAAAAAKAEAACERLADYHSWAFWFSQYRRAGENDGHVWAAIGQGLEKRGRGELRRVTAAGYAVGVLRKAGVVAA